MKKIICFFQEKPLWLICIVGVLLRLALYPFVQINDADATSRIYNSIDWLSNPTFISSGVWLPLHYYLTAFSMWIIPDRVLGPVLFHILFAVFTVIPIYKLTECLFNKKAAVLAAWIYILSPVVMKDSYHALAGVPFNFFVAWSFYYLYKAIFEESESIKYAILSGSFLTIASGIRYESWVLTAIFCFMIFFNRRWKELFLFFFFAMIFPLFWMIGNYIAHGDILYGVHGADYWNIQMEGVNDNLTTGEIKRRFFYFPFSWIIQQSCLPALIIIVGLIYSIVTKQIYKKKYIFLLPFIGILLAFCYKSVMGTLLTQHRFSILTILLSVPFVGLLYELPIKEKWQKIISTGTVILMLPMGFLNKTTFPIPRISNQSSIVMVNEIKKDTKNKSLILDCFGWDNTFYTALYSGIPNQWIFITDCSTHGTVYKEDNLFIKLDANPQGFLVLAENKLEKEIRFLNDNELIIEGYPKTLKVDLLEKRDGLKLYKYHF